MLFLLSGLSISLALLSVNGQNVECHNTFSCLLGSVSTTDDIECFGFSSCKQATSLVSTNGNVNCHGSYSCYESTLIQGEDGVDCYGLLSCASVTSIVSNSLTICRGSQSCRDTTILVESTTLPLICDGLRACSGSDLTPAGTTSLRGAFSGENSIIRTTGSVIFGAHKAGDGAEVICTDTECDITCYGTGCDDLTLSCDPGVPGCNFDIDCNNALQSTLCPDAPQLPLSFSFPDISSMEFSTEDNSINLCYTLTTGSLSCDDYLECNNIGPLINIDPICCRGSDSCSNAGTLSGGIDNTNAALYNIAFRADGYLSAIDIDLITAPNGGDIYFAGMDATRESGTDFLTTIEGNGNNNVIVSGYSGIFQGQFVNNINNLYCLAPFSCSDVIGTNINGNVYAYGWRSVEGGSLSNIGGSVYCDAASGCNGLSVENVNGDIIGDLPNLNAINVDGNIVGYGMTFANIENVGGDVIGVGDGALSQSSITNVASVVCEGESCLTESVITQLSKLEVTGDNSLSGAVIISEAEDQGGEFSLIITGTNIDPYDVTCSETDNCEINCLSEDACGSMNLICDGICTLNCNSSFNCPDLPEQATPEPTNEPTEEPGSV